jgi:gamma-glutamylcyclotransferase (GGCT)/AIG2-like uncharacterized protein YtfP
MPLLFSYGTLQQEDVQVSIIGRRPVGEKDEILRFEQTLARIEDPRAVAEFGSTHHVNLRFNGNESSRVPGMVFEITDAELARVDSYEAAASYRRVEATLASGRQAWVYVHP